MYDYIVVGAGVSGLAFAQYMSKIGKRVLMLEENADIGGCHRVYRVDDLFAEHAPRVLFTSYLTFEDLLRDAGMTFDDLYVKYQFSARDTYRQVLRGASASELCAFAKAIAYRVADPTWGTDVSVAEFMKRHAFSDAFRDRVERVCRLADGATTATFSMNEFLYVIQISTAYSGLQPKVPNDVGLFRTWRAVLKSRGVDIVCDADVRGLTVSGGRVTGLRLGKGVVDAGAAKIILAMPPKALCDVIQNSDAKDAFGDLDAVRQWANDTAYLTYVTFCLHWASPVQIPKVWGFPRAEWGVGFIVMTDYMQFGDARSATVLSCAITFPERISSVTGKTVHQSTMDEVVRDAFRQLNLSVPFPDRYVASPDLVSVDGKWTTDDSAFVTSVGRARSLGPCSSIPNLFSLGTHNDRHRFRATTVESAVSNAWELATSLHPDVRVHFARRTPWTVYQLIRIILALAAAAAVERIHRL